eukprot:TRINITY_DN16364_c0_g1_i2.p1 TRINITY_DN16364_c0_g1~~TRINITY_DN16364_c0_g1_i2.p1  ORF type:complete len:393 (+),score=44.82 TRINITY_DN16364_c0_g1_i2:81-1181(+)
MPAPPLLVGVDVGSGSARAGVVTAAGEVLGRGETPILCSHPAPGLAEQCSTDIWNSVCASVRQALEVAGPGSASRVRGVGFDATCSLVVTGSDGQGCCVTPHGTERSDVLWDVVRWDDHRAVEQASRINSTGHRALESVGGQISPEMETPKLLWLKENLGADWWASVQHFHDLPDWLVYRATGSLVRSCCSCVCKWTYGAAGCAGWDDEYFKLIGLEDLCNDSHKKIGSEVRPLGECAGQLTQRAADELGLPVGCSVAVSLIDAHAGGVATACLRPVSADCDPEGTLVVVAGTSACFMASTPIEGGPVRVKGVWGPYKEAMIPGYWLLEGGQSCVGALCTHIVSTHPAYLCAGGGSARRRPPTEPL